MAGYAQHPNFSGVLLVGLGCEDNQIDQLVEEENLELGDDLAKLVMQETGGTRSSISRGIEMVEAMLEKAATKQRQKIPVSEIMVGLQCGGSDSFSGISANPALGAAVDRLVACGGTAILAETPEIYGAENLLLERAVSNEVGERLIGLLEWWDDYTSNEPQGFDNNPSPGNKAGGLTTILEKSLGAVAKGGTTNLVEVYGYGRPIDKRGLVFMDSPGFDPMSATGQVASGANLIAFTTGRGSCFGCRPAPSIKLATNSEMYRAHGRGHGHQLRHDPRRRQVDRRDGRGDLSRDDRHRFGQGNQERTARLWRRRVRAMARQRMAVDKGKIMPTINVTLLKGRSIDQKREFVEVVTREAARILKCSPDVVDIVFEDIEKHDWAVGGKLASDK